MLGCLTEDRAEDVVVVEAVGCRHSVQNMYWRSTNSNPVETTIGPKRNGSPVPSRLSPPLPFLDGPTSDGITVEPMVVLASHPNQFSKHHFF